MDKKIVEILCAKDEQAAKMAAIKFIEKCDLSEFKKLCEKMDYLFDFVRENVFRRLSQAINKNNFINILNFFEFYSPYFDEFFASTLSEYANEDLTDKILEILCNGTNEQKAYAASYFKFIHDPIAIDDLEKNLGTDFEPLFINSAMALGKMNTQNILEKFIENLKSNDDFVKLKAVKFVTAYGDISTTELLIESMMTSGMPENIAGEIVNLVSPLELIKNNFEIGALLLNNLINGLGEILPLENVFYYEIYDIAGYLLENSSHKETAVLLYNIKNKFDIITDNDEYIFDLDKNTKNEIFEIKNILAKNLTRIYENTHKLKEFLKEENPYLETAFEIIKSEKIKDFVEDICKLTKSKNETLVCEALSLLKELGELSKIDKTKINIKNANLKAISEQIFL